MGASTTTITEKDFGYKWIMREIQKLDGSYTDVGLFGSGESPSDNLAARMTIHEYGSMKNNIPKRPVNRDAFDNNLREIQKEVITEYNGILDRKQSARSMLSTVGEWYTGILKMEYTGGSFAPLKPATIARKGSSAPLIETALSRNSTTHKETMK